LQEKPEPWPHRTRQPRLWSKCCGGTGSSFLLAHLKKWKFHMVGPLLMCWTFKPRLPETPTRTRDVGPGTAPLNQAYGGSSIQPSLWGKETH
jgi:hypothetical protein